MSMLIIAQCFCAVMALMLINTLIRSLLRKTLNPQLTSTSRRLGKFEEYMEIFSNERQGTTNSCYVMTLHSKGKLKESLVRDALIRLAKRQPMLRAIVKTASNFTWFGRSKRCYFDIIEPTKVADMIDLTTLDLHASQWQKPWYDIATRPVGAGLLWQSVLFKEEYLSDSENYLNTIIFRVNHSIIDGVSGMKLCKQFLNHLNSLSEDPRVNNEAVPSLELLPSFYELICNIRPWSLWRYLQKCLGLFFITKFIRRLKLHISLTSKPEKPYPFIMMQPSPEVRNLMYKVFSESETAQIREVCKSKGATVTGALMAAVHFAQCKLIESKGPIVTKSQKLMHLFAVNGLPVCNPKPPDEYLGNFLLSEVFPMDYVSNKSDFWAVAQEATKGIQSIIRDGKNVSPHLAEYDIFTPREIVELLSPTDPREKIKLFVDNYISSAGAFTSDDDEMSAFKLQDCLYYSISFGFASFAGHYNITVNGKMAWVITCSNFVPQIIEDQFAMLCFDTLLNETVSQES